jgi:hypothetical protein
VTVAQDFLGYFGQSRFLDSKANNIRKLYSHPDLDCIPEAAMSHWHDSLHTTFTAIGSGFVAAAIAIPAIEFEDGERQPELFPFQRQNSILPSGEQGAPYLVVKGATVKQFRLTPAFSAHLQSGSHTVTAKYLDANGAGISGVTITFTIVGRNSALSGVTRVTDVSGTATWTYTDTGNAQSLAADEISAAASVTVSVACRPRPVKSSGQPRL